MIKSKKSMKGFTLLEIMIVIVILGVLATFLQPLFTRGGDAMKAKVITDDIVAINTAAKQWKGAANSYTGVSVTVLTGVELLPTAWGAGTGVNPVDGNYTAAAGTGATVVITATGMSTGLCDTVRRRLVEGAVSATCAAGTATVTFK